MVKSTLEARIQFFACNFLWDVLAMFTYLNEDMIDYRIDAGGYPKWNEQHESLLHWCLEERYCLIDQSEITNDEKERLFRIADEMSETIVFRWGVALDSVANKMYMNFPIMNRARWLYYNYCLFLRKTLMEFERVLLEYSSPIYYEHYRMNYSSFEVLISILGNEYRLINNYNTSSVEISEKARDRMDFVATKLASEWRQAVIATARDLTLPNFDT